VYFTCFFKLPTDQLPVIQVAGRSLHAVSGQVTETDMEESSKRLVKARNFGSSCRYLKTTFQLHRF